MAEQALAEGQSKRKFPLKTALLLLSILFIEAAVIISVMIFTGGPSDVRAATEAQIDQMQELEKSVEVLVVSGKFQNTLTGRSYMYDMDVHIVIKKKHYDRIESQVVRESAQIAADVRTIISQAEPTHLHEPTLATLTRQLKKVFDERFTLSSEDGSPIIDVVIPKFSQYRSDN